jgi:hypothetical protein
MFKSTNGSRLKLCTVTSPITITCQVGHSNCKFTAPRTTWNEAVLAIQCRIRAFYKHSSSSPLFVHRAPNRQIEATNRGLRATRYNFWIRVTAWLNVAEIVKSHNCAKKLIQTWMAYNYFMWPRLFSSVFNSCKYLFLNCHLFHLFKSLAEKSAAVRHDNCAMHAISNSKQQLHRHCYHINCVHCQVVWFIIPNYKACPRGQSYK